MECLVFVFFDPLSDSMSARSPSIITSQFQSLVVSLFVCFHVVYIQHVALKG